MLKFKKGTIITGTILLTLAGIISRILGFLYRIFLSNLIGAEGIGIFQMIFPALSFCVALSCGGIQTAVSRFVAESKSAKKSFCVLIASLIMSAFLSFLTMGILYTMSDPISEIILKNDACSDLLKYASFTIPMSAFHACVAGYYLGLKKPAVPAVLQISEQITKVASIIIIGMVLIGNGTKITPVIAVYSLIISELTGMFICIFALSLQNLHFRFSDLKSLHVIHNIKMLLSVSYILTMNRIMLSFLQSVEAILIPLVLVKYGLTSAESLSIYGILAGMALPVIAFPAAISNSVAMMVMPDIAHANVTGDKKRLESTTNLTVWFSMVSGIFCIGTFIFYGDFIGNDIFGHAEAGKYIKTLAWLCPFMYMSISFGSILHGLGKTTTAFVHNVIEICIRLFFLWFIVPYFGISAYLYGLLLSQLTTTLLHGFYINRYVKINHSPVRNIIKPTAWLVISLAMGYLTSYILNYHNCSHIALNFIFKGLSAIVICVVFFSFAFKEWLELRKF